MHLHNTSSVKLLMLFSLLRSYAKNLKVSFPNRTVNLLHDPLGPLDGSG